MPGAIDARPLPDGAGGGDDFGISSILLRLTDVRVGAYPAEPRVERSKRRRCQASQVMPRVTDATVTEARVSMRDQA